MRKRVIATWDLRAGGANTEQMNTSMDMAMALIRQQQQQHGPSNGVPHGMQVRNAIQSGLMSIHNGRKRNLPPAGVAAVALRGGQLGRVISNPMPR